MSRRIVIHNHIPKSKTRDDDVTRYWVSYRMPADISGPRDLGPFDSETEAQDAIRRLKAKGARQVSMSTSDKARDADYNNLNAWKAAVLSKYPNAVIKWNGDRTYKAYLGKVGEGLEIAQFDYGDIKGGDLLRGYGNVDRARDTALSSSEQMRYDLLMGRYQRYDDLTKEEISELGKLITKKRTKDRALDGQRFSNKNKGTLGLPVGEFEVTGKIPGKAMPWGTFSDLTVKDLGTGKTYQITTGNAQMIFGIGRDAAEHKYSFDDWMKLVDAACQSKSGMSIHDLPDCPFRDWYDKYVPPENAASRCLRSAGGGDAAKDAKDGFVHYMASQFAQWKADAEKMGDRVVEMYDESPNEPEGSGPWSATSISGQRTGEFDKGKGGTLSKTTDASKEDLEAFHDFEHGTTKSEGKIPTYRHKTSGKEIVSTQNPGAEWEKVGDAKYSAPITPTRLATTGRDATNYEKIGFTREALMGETLGYLQNQLSLANGDLRSAKEDDDKRTVSMIERQITMLEDVMTKKRAGKDSAVAVPVRLSSGPTPV